MAGYGYPSMSGGYSSYSPSGMYGSPQNPTINPVMPPSYNLGNSAGTGATSANGGMLKGRLVSSLEEVKGALIDFDGSIHYFHDIAGRKIYTKQFNMDGTTTILMYSLVEPVVASPQQTQDYVTREEFNALLRELNELKGVQQNESTRITGQNASILSANDF